MTAVHLEIRGRIAEVRLDNPAKLNAFTAGMLDSLAAHLETVERRPGIACLLVTAAPARAFCAGADIAEWAGMTPADFARDWVRGGHRVFDRLARLARPTIAVVHAHAFGGGLELAAACDLRVMAPGATLALPETGLGIVPGWSGSQRLLRLLPEPVVKELALFGRRLTADRALALGFAAELAEDPLAAAEAIAARLCDLSPRAVEIAKAMIHAAANEDRAAMIETLAAAASSATQDKTQGMTAFQNKQKPAFPGT